MHVSDHSRSSSSIKQMHSLNTCLFVIPFSVIVSRNAATLLEIMNVCRSTRGSGVAFNELHTVLFVCVLPSYSSIEAVFLEIGKERKKYFINCFRCAACPIRRSWRIVYAKQKPAGQEFSTLSVDKRFLPSTEWAPGRKMRIAKTKTSSSLMIRRENVRDGSQIFGKEIIFEGMGYARPHKAAHATYWFHYGESSRCRLNKQANFPNEQSELVPWLVDDSLRTQRFRWQHQQDKRWEHLERRKKGKNEVKKRR